VGDESGGTGVAAATGEALAVGVAEFAEAGWPDWSAQALCSRAITIVRSIAHMKPPIIKCFRRCIMAGFISLFWLTDERSLQ
jgi:hypothetical protein